MPPTTCPTFTSAPANVSIVNSSCGSNVVSGGSITAPAGTPCPVGSTLQYQVGGGSWSATLPVYAQTGPAQSIKTRCSCDSDANNVSAESNAVTTVPGTCAPIAPCSWEPVGVVGFNWDVVAETTPASARTTGAIDLTDHVFYSQTYPGSSGTGLPTSRTITTGAITYNLADYDLSNALYLPGTSGTLSFINTLTANAIGILWTGTEGGAFATVTVNFSDGTSEAFSGNAVPDWFGGSSPAFIANGRVVRSTGAIEDFNTGNPRLYSRTFTLSAIHQGKLIQSVHISSSARIVVFAVARQSNCCPSFSTPGNVIINNGICGPTCDPVNPSIAPPSGGCPSGSSIQYSVNNGPWSSTLPAYAAGLTIRTRCVCDIDPLTTSPVSSGATTNPGNCTDLTPPGITCPGTQTLALGANCSASLPNYTGLAITGDNCGVQGVTQSPAAGTTVSGAGNMTVTLTVTDVNGRTTPCSFTVNKTDNTPPTAVCKNTTVLIGSAGTYTFQPADVFNATASSDNCSGVLTVTNISPAIVNCSQLNQTIPVTVTVQDGSGNTATCTAQVTVQEGTALPGGWSNANIGNANGASSYKACLANGTFTVSATGFSTSSSDVLYLTSQQLCGNGEIIARVATVSGGGWGGVMIRENLMPGAKKVTLKTQLNSIIRREIRSITNGAAALLNFNRPQHVWLRLVRNGSVFTGYTSINGASWTFAFSATVSMAGCVQVGVFSESINAGTTTTATFTNVSVTGSGSNLAADLANVNAPSENGEQVRVFPNPTTGEVTIDLDIHAGKPGTIQVFNALGALTTQERLVPGNPETHRLRIGDLAGVYTVVIQLEDSRIVRRVVVNPNGGK